MSKFLNDLLKDISEEDETVESKSIVKPQSLCGRCILSIRFQNKYEYQKWLKYNPNRQWDFLVEYPAIMQAEYIFKTVSDVEMMAMKIVQLLQLGFTVYSAKWELKDCESQLKQPL